MCFPTTASSARGELARCFEASSPRRTLPSIWAVLYITASTCPTLRWVIPMSCAIGRRWKRSATPFGRSSISVESPLRTSCPSRRLIQHHLGPALRHAGERRVPEQRTVNPGNSGGPLSDQTDLRWVSSVRGSPVTQGSRSPSLSTWRGLPRVPRPRVVDAFSSLPGPDQFRRQRVHQPALAPRASRATSPFRSRVESDPGPAASRCASIAAFTPFTTRQLEESLLDVETFERVSVDTNEKSDCLTRRRRLACRSRRRNTRRADIRMQHGARTRRR